MVRTTSAEHAAHASSSEAAKAAVIVPPAAASASSGCSFHYGTKSNGLAYAQVHRDIRRTLSEVNGYRAIGLSRTGNKEAERVCRRQHGAFRRSHRETRTRIEYRGAQDILRNGDVVRLARMGEDEWAQPQSERRRERAAKEEPVPGVEARAAVIGPWIIWVSRETAGPRSIAIRVAQRVKAKNGEIRAHSHVHVRHELVLLEDTLGLIFVDPSCGATERARRIRRKRSRQRRIDVVSKQLVKSAGVQVSKRELRRFCKLMFDSNCRLQNVGSAQVWIDPIDVRRHAC